MQIPSSVSTRLQYQHKSLLDILDGLSDEQIRRQVQPGKWSIFENIVHLQTYQHTFITRVQKILEEDNPNFSAYTAEADPLFPDNCTKTSREIIQDLLSTRKEMAAGILSFKETDFVKTANHPAYGKMSLLMWLNFFLLHEAHHLFTIFKLGGMLKKENPEPYQRFI
ncbi:DinB family protein [Terrimonas pollutisoli]|uniref:DinB family protein n=1 Tax=Terrimonas pollutisoli TaxID=3034147 RepID=UPI0023EC25C8|nr:DinB family protein [Terrimonas sp. H1YJ31]